MNLESYQSVEHLDKACKNDKLERNLMCSVGCCTKIFGGEIQLRHHYKMAHPGAIFDIDFLPLDKDKDKNNQTDYLEKEAERTEEFLHNKIKWIKQDVEVAKKKFVKKNTLYRVMTDDFKDHDDYDEIY